LVKWDWTNKKGNSFSKELPLKKFRFGNGYIQDSFPPLSYFFIITGIRGDARKTSRACPQKAVSQR
jgi:hypothetical protein